VAPSTIAARRLLPPPLDVHPRAIDLRRQARVALGTERFEVSSRSEARVLVFYTRLILPALPGSGARPC
jgi:hypothetical protein